MPQNAFFLFLNDNRGKIRDKLEEEGVHLSGRSQSYSRELEHFGGI